jgi:putative membrane protein
VKLHVNIQLEDVMKSFQRSMTVLSVVAGLSAGSVFAQDNTHSGQNSQIPPRGLQDNANMDTNPNNNLANRNMSVGGDEGAEQLRKIAQNPEMAPDKLFALHAGMSNQWEIEFSNLVAEKAKDNQIKELARMVAQDHQAAQSKLASIAEKMDIRFSSQLPASKQAKLEVFRALPVDKLEACYLSNQKAGHLAAVSDYADHAAALQQPELKAYAAEVLPKIRAHTNEIIRLAASKGMPTDLNFNSTSASTR